MHFSSKHIRPFLLAILVVSLLGTYLRTLAPGLTWANYGSDGGDLIAAAATGGVAHPTGYPLYLLLARLFQLLPIGSLAFRTNLLSALATTLSATLVFELVVRSLPPSNGHPNWWAGLASAYSFGLAPLVWSQAVITEVYGVHILFVVLILFLSSGTLPSSFTLRRLDLCLGLTFGLGMANHVTTILLLPLLFSVLAPGQPGFSSFARRIVWTGAGLLVYLTLPLRALRSPPINWGNPLTLEGFRWLVLAGPYQERLLSLGPASLWERVRDTAGLLLGQAGLPGFVLAVVGLVFFLKLSALHRNVIWTMIAFSTFAILYGTWDFFVYLMPVCLGLSIWIGIGLAGIMERFPQRAVHLFGLTFVLFLFLLAANHWHAVDASQDARAETFGREVLSQAPPDAIIFAKGDQAIFTLWYFHFAVRQRPDVTVVATELLGFDWYQQSLHGAYPELQLPGPFAFAERMAALNPGRPACFVEYIREAQIQCRTGSTPP